MREKVERAAKTARRAGAGLLSRLWNLAMDAVWLAAVAVVVSAAIWSLHLYGQKAGWSYPPLDAAAATIEKFWRGAWERVGGK